MCDGRARSHGRTDRQTEGGRRGRSRSGGTGRAPSGGTAAAHNRSQPLTGSAGRPKEGRLEITKTFPSAPPQSGASPSAGRAGPEPPRQTSASGAGGERVEEGKRKQSTSTFSSLKCTLLASCSLVPTSGYLVSWKRFSSASSCSSVKMVRCRLFRRQCSWFSNCSSVRDNVPTFM